MNHMKGRGRNVLGQNDMKQKVDLEVFCRNFVTILQKCIQNDSKLKFDLEVFYRDSVRILLGGSENPPNPRQSLKM